MGICDSSQDKSKEVRSRNKGHRKGEEGQTSQRQLRRADENSSRIEDDNEVDRREKILKKGIKKEIQKMIDNYEDDIDAYSFDQSLTLLLKACSVCDDSNSYVIDMILSKGADVNKEEYNTGNTALFLSAVDLKVEFVKKLIQYNADIMHKNHDKQNIKEFLYFNLIEQKKNIGVQLTPQEKKKYSQILKILGLKNDDNDSELN